MCAAAPPAAAAAAAATKTRSVNSGRGTGSRRTSSSERVENHYVESRIGSERFEGSLLQRVHLQNSRATEILLEKYNLLEGGVDAAAEDVAAEPEAPVLGSAVEDSAAEPEAPAEEAPAKGAAANAETHLQI